MRATWVLVALGCATGCDSAFDLEAIPVLPHYGSVINDPDGDADGDGAPNATDLCALIPSTDVGGRADTDGDGVGDLCDPEPNLAGNCLALFDSFESSTVSPHWHFEGETVTVDGGKLVIPGGAETIVYLDTALTLDAVYVDGYVQIGANAGGTRHAIQLLVDTTFAPLVGGHACSVESDSQSSTLAIDEVTAGASGVSSSAPVGDILVAAGTTVDTLSWTPAGCHVELSDVDRSQEATLPTGPPVSGVLGVRVVDAGFWIYTIAGYGRGCGT